jgi:adenine-specific DNA-methyltransferase
MNSTTLDQAFNDVQKLVEKFEKGKDHYMSPSYSESEARQDFIDDFFIALGWDVTHKHQHNPYQQEVKIERSQKQQNESARKRADYAFFMAPNFKDVQFFVEAKKPSVLIHNTPSHYFQTIKYGWNASCPVSILTDFEELVIIDCRSKPNIKYALNGKHKSYRYTDYANKEKFAEIYYLFSKEAIAKNSIEEYAKSLPKTSGRVTQKQLFKGGYQAIDESFLEYIDGIRETIAKAFKKADEHLDSEQLTEATQRTVDRLVFIRFLEDKYIEPINHINEWAASANPWKAFISDCKTLNVKYNGVVFKPLFIDKDNFLGADDKLFGEICKELSSDNSPYDFNYIPIHILGSIYERFLGKVVIATAKQVRIEEKPEVRKAGGVFYTPKYIVDYIVANTVGKLIEGKTPNKIAEMTFADIACGSGSFLIGVYDYLLQYHKDYYSKYPTAAEKDGCVKTDGVWTLSIKQKQNILLNNIYGVDIDNQAVEVTQLSLFLKMLEDESLTSTMAQAKQTSLYTKVLPDLTSNIVCGNSLIQDESNNIRLFSSIEERELNTMSYELVFPKIFKKGGFDLIIGNPPYVNLVSLPLIQRNYFQKFYQTCKNKSDLYSFFIEKATKLINPQNGKIGYIVPHTWLATDSFILLRKLLLDNKLIESISEMGFNVFKDAIVSTVILICSPNNKKIRIEDKNFNLKFEIDIKKCINNDYYIDLDWSIQKEKIYNKLKSNTDPLNSIIQFSRGIKTSDDNRFVIKEQRNKDCKKIFRGKNVKAYQLNWNGEYVWYRPDLMKEKVGCLPHSKAFFEVPEKLITQRVNSSGQLLVAYDDSQQYFLDTTNVSRFDSWNKIISLKFICGLLNSKLINYWYCNKYKMPTIGGYELHSIPIIRLDFTNSSDLNLYNKIINLVEQMLEAKLKLQTLTIQKDIDYYEKKCTTLDRQIDSLVYKLYDLNEEEIKIVEEKLLPTISS